MRLLIDHLRRRRDEEAGFTLLEIMVALALLTLIVVPATTFMLNMQKSEKVVRDSTLQQADAHVHVVPGVQQDPDLSRHCRRAG